MSDELTNHPEFDTVLSLDPAYRSNFERVQQHFDRLADTERDIPPVAGGSDRAARTPRETEGRRRGSRIPGDLAQAIIKAREAAGPEAEEPRYTLRELAELIHIKTQKRVAWYLDDANNFLAAKGQAPILRGRRGPAQALYEAIQRVREKDPEAVTRHYTRRELASLAGVSLNSVDKHLPAVDTRFKNQGKPEVLIWRRATQPRPQRPSRPRTTWREVAQLIAEGKANSQIAQERSVSESAIQNHITTLNKRYGTSTRWQLVRTLIQRGLVRTDTPVIQRIQRALKNAQRDLSDQEQRAFDGLVQGLHGRDTAQQLSTTVPALESNLTGPMHIAFGRYFLLEARKAGLLSEDEVEAWLRTKTPEAQPLFQLLLSDRSEAEVFHDMGPIRSYVVDVEDYTRQVKGASHPVRGFRRKATAIYPTEEAVQQALTDRAQRELGNSVKDLLRPKSEGGDWTLLQAAKRFRILLSGMITTDIQRAKRELVSELGAQVAIPSIRMAVLLTEPQKASDQPINPKRHGYTGSVPSPEDIARDYEQRSAEMGFATAQGMDAHDRSGLERPELPTVAERAGLTDGEPEPGAAEGSIVDEIVRRGLETPTVSAMFVRDPTRYSLGASWEAVSARYRQEFAQYLDIAVSDLPASDKVLARGAFDSLLTRVDEEEGLRTLPARQIEGMVFALIRRFSGSRRPLDALKRRWYEAAIPSLPALWTEVQAQPTDEAKLRRALELATAANQFGIREFLKASDPAHPRAFFDRVIQPVTIPAPYDQFGQAWERLKQPGPVILYVLDNVGEDVADLVLIRLLQQLGHRVIVVAHDQETANDVTVRDMQQLLADETVSRFLTEDGGQLPHVIASGSDTRGTDLRLASQPLREAWDSATLVIAKGEGNRGSLANLTKDLVNLVYIKNPEETEGAVEDTGVIEFVAEGSTQEAARLIQEAFENYRRAFHEMTARATETFRDGNWQEVVIDARQRLELHDETLERLVPAVEAQLGSSTQDLAVWQSLRAAYTNGIGARYERDLAETFFNSVARRLLGPRATDVEYPLNAVALAEEAAAPEVYRRYRSAGQELAQVLGEILDDYRATFDYEDRQRDVRLAAQALAAALQEQGIDAARLEAFEILREPFYRNTETFLFGRLPYDGRILPLAIALRRGARGVVVDAVILEEREVWRLFGSRRSSFHVDEPRHRELIRFLRTIVPQRLEAGLYSSIGLVEHAERLLMQGLLEELAAGKVFAMAEGSRGKVMITFTLPGFDYAFKLIKDQFDE
ncbi:MAG: bifunctional isocitrate dehydrogenase kinase/phosphatase, partial [Candidatus Omnitrophota bacterium]|nr:bifunctional isocitrate dehydrogenase kinase/phosphatase [Candidatus Omnitrophota bacterium]